MVLKIRNFMLYILNSVRVLIWALLKLLLKLLVLSYFLEQILSQKNKEAITQAPGRILQTAETLTKCHHPELLSQTNTSISVTYLDR